MNSCFICNTSAIAAAAFRILASVLVSCGCGVSKHSKVAHGLRRRYTARMISSRGAFTRVLCCHPTIRSALRRFFIRESFPDPTRA